MKVWTRAARDDLRAVLQAGLAAVTPQVFLRERLRWDGRALWLDGRPIDLKAATVRIAAVGKAAHGMAAQFFPLPAAHRLLVTPQPASLPGWECIRGEHPVPGAGSEAAGRRLLEMARATAPDDLLVLLLSGGASSLCEAPRVPLADLQVVTRLLLQGGAEIAETNAVRKHLSAIKGGRLVEAAQGRVVVLALSDVPGDEAAVLASGPASPDPSTCAQAVATLRDRGLWEQAPSSVRELLESGEETLKPGDRVFDRAEVHVLAGNATALWAAAREAARRGYAVEVGHDALRGEARTAGEHLAASAREAVRAAAADGRRRALILGGETAVTVRGAGRGGRNQELVLAAVGGVAGRPVVVASFATDGVDGPTEAAGAVADGYTLARAEAAGLAVEEHLAENDAFHFFERLEDLIRTGPTGTNVMDLAVALVGTEGKDS